jgi:ABC-type amino acid transport system permease subunit
MSENTQSYSAKGEVSNITKRRTRFERIKIAFSKAPLSAWFGMIVLSIYLIAAFFAPFIAPHGEAEVFSVAYAPWGGEHLLGTDQIGRDILSRLIFASRNTLGICFLACSIALIIGTIFGIIAMFFYPFMAYYLFSGDELASGLFLGTSIHETAQVAGAGLIYAEQFNSPKTMDIATITKLVRNVSMIIVIPSISYIYLRNNIGNKNSKPSLISMFPIFIIGFILMGLIRSIGDYGIQNSNLAFEIAAWSFNKSAPPFPAQFIMCEP